MRALMNHSIDHSHRDPDLFGLLYGFSFRPGERGREIDSARALQYLQHPQDTEQFLWLHLNLAHAACERPGKNQPLIQGSLPVTFCNDHGRHSFPPQECPDGHPSFTAAPAPACSAKPQLDNKPGVVTLVVFFAVLSIGNLQMAWVLTLPSAILLSGSLYWLFTQLF
jgi:hypothetical protein